MNNSFSRRKFLNSALIAGTAGVITPGTLLASGNQHALQKNSILKERPKVLFFDVNETLLDLTEMKVNVPDLEALVKELVSL